MIIKTYELRRSSYEYKGSTIFIDFFSTPNEKEHKRLYLYTRGMNPM